MRRGPLPVPLAFVPALLLVAAASCAEGVQPPEDPIELWEPHSLLSEAVPACWRPDRDLIWNQPAPDTVHPESDRYVRRLWHRGSDRDGNFNLLESYAVYMASVDESRMVVMADRGNLAGQMVPFRPIWQPYHSDQQVIVIHPDGEVTDEYYEATVDPLGGILMADRADRLRPDQITSDGIAANPPSRGIGIPYIHMLVTDCEIRSGRIDHALSLRVAGPDCDTAWFPASKVEGHPDCSDDGVPMGARFVASLPAERVDRWAAKLRAEGGPALEAFGRSLADALETYGFYVTDNGGETAGFDIQHPLSFAAGNPIREFARDEERFRDLLDGLLREEDLRLIAEVGPRLNRD